MMSIKGSNIVIDCNTVKAKSKGELSEGPCSNAHRESSIPVDRGKTKKL
jgi:hypothetical protein